MPNLPQDIEFINEQLVSRFGRTATSGPRYRIIWTENELEYRKITHYNRMELIRPEIHLVRKYSYIKDRFILEKFLTGLDNTELVEKGGTYEPIWVFEDKKLGFIMPTWKAVEFLAKVSDMGVKETLSDMQARDKERFDAEVRDIEDMLNSDGIDYGNQEVNFVKPVYYNDLSMKKDEE